MCNSKADSLPTSPATSKENTVEPEGDIAEPEGDTAVPKGDTAVPKKDTAGSQRDTTGSQGDTTDGATSPEPSMGQNSRILDRVFAEWEGSSLISRCSGRPSFPGVPGSLGMRLGRQPFLQHDNCMNSQFC